MKKFILILLTLSQILSATECKVPVVFLKEGSVTSCDGFLFSREKELEVRIKLTEYNLLEEENKLKTKQIDNLLKYSDNLEKIIKDKDNQIVLWQSRATESTEKLIGSESNRSLRDIAFFGLGLLTVLFGAWAISRVK